VNETERTDAASRIACTGCGSPEVVAMDVIGEPMCVRCRAIELGGYDGQQSTVIELLELIGSYIVERGMLHRDDAVRAFAEAVGVADQRRRTLGLRPPSRYAETAEALNALAAYAALGEEGS
jgi:hypothetical protein